MNEIDELLAQAKNLAKRYKELIGRPLGITAEVAEFWAAQLLCLQLMPPRNPGYDAIRDDNGTITKYQIKGRIVPANGSPGQRVGRIRFDYEWDVALLVLMDEDFEVISIFEASRADIARALAEPGSKARTKRGALSVRAFKSIGRKVWPSAEPCNSCPKTN